MFTNFDARLFKKTSECKARQKSLAEAYLLIRCREASSATRSIMLRTGFAGGPFNSLLG
jgi:hypothetical protein